MPWKAPTHKAQETLEATRQRKREYSSRHRDRLDWYSQKPWRDCRAAFLAIPENVLCADCLKHGIRTPTQEVHHVKDRVEFPDLALDHANLVGLCKRCHSRRTMTEMKEKR